MNNNTPIISSEEVIKSLSKGFDEKGGDTILNNTLFESQDIASEVNICLYPEEVESRFSDLIEKHFSNDKDLFYGAINLVKEKHKNQYRDENTPYYTHLMLTAIYCFENGGTKNEVLASLLHDILEDTDMLYIELEESFGKEVAELVKLVSFSIDGEKIDEKIYYQNLIKDSRAILIKGADRLSNIYSTLFTEDSEWVKGYIERTKKQVIQLLENDYPELANKILEVIEYIENNSLNEVQISRIQDLKQIKYIREKL